MVVARGCALTIQNEREFQEQNKRLQETLKQYGVELKPQRGVTLLEENRRLRVILQRTWIRFWGGDR